MPGDTELPTPAEATGSPTPAGRVCVFVVGMHRSGTSATAGTLNALGLAAPSGDDLLAAGEWNERGFFESKRLVAFNNHLLATLGGTWSAPPKLSPGWEADHALDALRAQAATLFAESFPVRPAAWKDPRNCITLPFWRTVIAPPLAAVFVYRDPMEVARSLQTRNGDGMTYGLALWDRHLRDACANLVGLPTLVADYGRTLDAPAPWVDELVDFLRSVGVDVDNSARQTAISSLDADLRHQRTPVAQNSGMWDSQLEVVQTLAKLDGSHRQWGPVDLGPEPEWVDEVLALRLEGDKLRRIERILHTSRAFRMTRFVWNLRHRGTSAGLLPDL
jgi:hypothetical protein